MAEAKRPAAVKSGLHAALIKAVAKFPDLTKDGQGKWGKFGTLPATLKAVREPLAAQGLVITQPVTWRPETVNTETGETTPGQAYQETILTHAPSGESLRSELPLNVNQDEKMIGSSMTYFRRYLVCSLLGIQADDMDLDLDQVGQATESQLTELRELSQEIAKRSGFPMSAEKYRSQVAARLKIRKGELLAEQVIPFAAALGEIAGRGAASGVKKTGVDPLLEAVVAGALDPADMPITPKDAGKGEGS